MISPKTTPPDPEEIVDGFRNISAYWQISAVPKIAKSRFGPMCPTSPVFKKMLVDAIGAGVIKSVGRCRSLFNDSLKRPISPEYWNPTVMILDLEHDRVIIRTGDFPLLEQQNEGDVLEFRDVELNREDVERFFAVVQVSRSNNKAQNDPSANVGSMRVETKPIPANNRLEREAFWVKIARSFLGKLTPEQVSALTKEDFERRLKGSWVSDQDLHRLPKQKHIFAKFRLLKPQYLRPRSRV